MLKRGKILRDTSIGDGLLSIDGQQYPFKLDGIWKSDVSPKVDMVVEAAFSGANEISSITVVADNQLAKEQAELAVAAMKEKSAQLASGVVAKFGIEVLVAMALLILGWFFLNTVSIQISSSYGVGISFWQTLAIVNSPAGVMNSFGAGGIGGGSGGYGFLAIVALIAPMAPFFWKDPRAHLGGLLPLLFMILMAAMIYSGIHDGMKQAQNAASSFGGQQAQQMIADMTASMTAQAMKAISIGMGGYLSVAVGLYFAGKGVIKFLAAKA
ncbi:hypothetical protein ACO0LO_22325 [Undibacterium sp. TJN25]|uniref:hypothetical protein n=1 Tax=Undibacterium sp. TJN25 TaxID=3413056 RepID=UPI003BF2220F